MSECATKCQMCDKRGLPLLVTRYAIAPDDSGAPIVNGSFAVVDTDGKAMPLGGKAIYTQRLLRSGYLYVFDEARNKWQGYFVTAEGYLMPFAITPFGPLGPAVTGDPAKIAPCNRQANGAVAGCITITSPKQASNFWLGFSDVEWTPAVWKQHQDAAFRARHMRKFDVQHWMASGTHHHAGGIHLHAANVAEYAPATKKQAFAFSPAPFADRKGCSESLIKAFENIQPGKGAFVAIDDPAGIAMDLAMLMTDRLDRFNASPKYQRPLTVSTAIQGLRAQIEHQSETQAVLDAQMRQSEMIGQSPFLSFTESGRKLIDEADDVSPAELDLARTDAWKKYLSKYNEPKRSAFQKQYDAALQAFDAEQIAPLALAHAAWMKSKRLANSMTCNFDPQDTNSGRVYTTALMLCIGKSQDKKACFDVYADWLNGSLQDKKNLLLRALLLNQDNYAKEIAKGTKVSVDPRGLPWDGMIGNVGKSIETVLKGEPELLGKYIALFAGVMARPIAKFAESGALPEALVALGVVSKSPILRMEFSGNMEDFQRYVIGEMLRLRGSLETPYALKAAVDREIQLLKIKGTKLAGTRSKKFLVLADVDALKGVGEDGTKRAFAQALAKTLAHPDDLEKLQLGRWRNGFNVAKSFGKTSLPFAFAVLAGIVQWVALGKLGEDLDTANAKGKGQEEARFRYYAGWAGFGGGVTETLGNAMEKLPEVALNFGKGLLGKTSLVLRWGGKLVGIAGAAVMAWFDVQHASEEWHKGNVGLAVAYGTSAVLGVSGAVVLAFATGLSATGIGLILVLLAIGISVLIEFIKDNPLQEWLESSYFGKNTFQNLNTEMKELKALAS